jgi:hypothetical protein
MIEDFDDVYDLAVEAAAAVAAAEEAACEAALCETYADWA